jgi:error-prone DNA polymerase
MKRVEEKLRRGMSDNGIDAEAQENILQSITSFALYGFPESHSASFALLAYASAYIKEHYLAAFTAALLNNQPMGFYSPATIVKDAQRHGLKVLPVDASVSAWNCTVETVADADALAMRLGLRYVRGLREAAGRALVAARQQRAFESIDDLVRRVPELHKDELVMLANVGALNAMGADRPHFSLGNRNLKLHRRDALWQVARAGRPTGPLLNDAADEDAFGGSPLRPMEREERLVADFQGTGLTIGPHPMAYKRAEFARRGIQRAIDLARIPDGRRTKIAGCVIARQRPGTASGFIFLSLEDETGISNAIIAPKLYEQNRMTVLHGSYLMVEGVLQNLENVISVKAQRIEALDVSAGSAPSHDFH